MNCRECGRVIPQNVIKGDSFKCPYCGHIYRRKAPAPQNAPRTVTKLKREESTGIPFRILRLVVDIFSAIMFIIIMVQSCAANVVNAIDANTADTSAGGGTLLAFLLLIAGITGAVGRNSKKATMIAGIIFVIGALIGFISLGTFKDLVIWSILALIFGAIHIISAIRVGK